MNDYGHTPPELMKQMQATFLTLFGGKEKVDIWLNRIADQMADAGSPANRPINIDPAVVPAEIQSLMHRPREVVDLIIERLESLSIFSYTAEIINQGETCLVIVKDKLSGHVMEEAHGLDPDSLTRSLVEKYGRNLEVL